MKMSLQNFFDRFCNDDYRAGLYVPKDLMAYCNSLLFDAIRNGKDRNDVVIEVSDIMLDAIEANRQSDLKREELYRLVSKYRLDGMDLEKTDIDKAIECYKKSIELGEGANMFYAYAHSFKRIIILFHKMKNYKDEIIYCSKYLENDLSDSERLKYSERLSQLKKKYGELEQKSN